MTCLAACTGPTKLDKEIDRQNYSSNIPLQQHHAAKVTKAAAAIYPEANDLALEAIHNNNHLT